MANIAAALAVISAVLATSAFVLIMIVWSKPEAIAPGSMTQPKSESTTKPEAEKAGPDSETEGGGRPAVTYPPDERVYVISINTWKRPYKYFNDDGDLDGTMIEFGKAVCKAAGKQCRFPYIGIDSTPCFDGYTSMGLEEQWFDACIGYYKTPERSNVVKFSQQLLAPATGRFYVLKDSGKTPDGIDTGVVAFGSTEAATAACAERFGFTVAEDNKRFGQSPSDVLDIVKNGMADYALLVMDSPPEGFDVVGPPLECTLSGLGLMVSKTSDMLGWFNAGIRQIMEDGTYRKICNEAEEKHGASMPCL